MHAANGCFHVGDDIRKRCACRLVRPSVYMLAALPVAILDCFLHVHMGCSIHVYYFPFDIKDRRTPPAETETGDHQKLKFWPTPGVPRPHRVPLPRPTWKVPLAATAGEQTASE